MRLSADRYRNKGARWQATTAQAVEASAYQAGDLPKVVHGAHAIPLGKRIDLAEVCLQRRRDDAEKV